LINKKWSETESDKLGESTMFALLCSRQVQLLNSRRTQLGVFQQNAFFILKSFTSIAFFESNEKQQEEKHSFTVSYLVNSCGVSPKSAILASKRMNFENTERPDSVLNFLKEKGFSHTQISKVVRAHPRFLLSDPEKTLLPKIEFFRSLGLRALTSLGSSLQTQCCSEEA
jgi:hypothetical protein